MTTIYLIQVCLWTSSEIVAAGATNNRNTVYKFFLSIAEELYRLKNFHSLMAVWNGLDSVFVAKLDLLNKVLHCAQTPRGSS